MIFGHIEKSNFDHFHPIIKKALVYLKNTDLSTVPTGQYSMDDFIVQVIDLNTKVFDEIKPEVHRKKIDIQYLHQGIEKIGVSSDTGNNKPASHYLPERDIQFYEDSENEFFIQMIPGNFAIFYPEDVHRPACVHGAPSAIRKIVVKINLDKLM